MNTFRKTFKVIPSDLDPPENTTYEVRSEHIHNHIQPCFRLASGIALKIFASLN